MKLLVECKGLNTRLEEKHLSQLFRYYTVTNAKFAMLTNGRVFNFYSDLDEPNKLDRKPFFVFDLSDYSQSALAELSKFEKSAFDVEGILQNAERLKHVSSVKSYLLSQVDEPSDEFVKTIAAKVYDGRVTAQVRQTIGSAVKTAFKEVIRDTVQTRLSSALASSSQNDAEVEEIVEGHDEIVTTEEEIEGMLTIRGIVRNVIDGSRIDLRDAKSYCAVLVDDNNRKPVARLHFNRKQKYLGLFDGEKEERIAIQDLGEIYDYADRLRDTVKRYTDT